MKDVKISAVQIERLKHVADSLFNARASQSILRDVIKEIEDDDMIETMKANSELDMMKISREKSFAKYGENLGVCAISVDKEPEFKINREQLERFVFHIGSIAEEQMVLSLHLKKIAGLTREIVVNKLKGINGEQYMNEKIIPCTICGYQHKEKDLPEESRILTHFSWGCPKCRKVKED